MKKELLVVMIIVGWNVVQASDLQKSNSQSFLNNVCKQVCNKVSEDRRRPVDLEALAIACDLQYSVSNSSLDNVCQQVNDNRSQSRMSSDSQYEFEAIEEAMQEEAFYSGPEVKKACRALLSGLNQEIALKTIQNAFRYSPTIHATSALMKDLNQIYYNDTPYVKQLEREITDGSRTGEQRATSQQKLDHLRSTSSFFKNCHSTPPIASYGSSLSNSGANTPLNFNSGNSRK